MAQDAQPITEALMNCASEFLGPIPRMLCDLGSFLTETWVGAALLLLVFLWLAGFLFRSGWDAAGRKGGSKRA